jgi:outer membrane protein assembly factor BamB
MQKRQTTKEHVMAAKSDYRKPVLAVAVAAALAMGSAGGRFVPGGQWIPDSCSAAQSGQAAATADWPQFLGPDRTGISRETGLLDQWPAGGLKALWRAPGGVGMSGLAIAGGRLFTMWQRDGQQRVVALDAETGKPAWDTPFGPAYRNRMGDGPRATPAVVGDMVYAYSGEGHLLALRCGDGSIVWRHDVVGELGGEAAEYGMASSPLPVGDWIVVTAGAPHGAVVAFDRQSGKPAWKSGSDSAGYSSPALRLVGDREQIVAFTGKAAVGIAPKDGAELWRYAYETDFDCNIATPLAHRGRVFISAGENHGCALLRLQPAGERFEVEEVWTSQGPRSVMRNEWQTAVLLDGHLYGFDNVGSAGPVTHLNCVEIASGKLVWQKERFGKGNLIAADGKLWITTMRGELVLVRATPRGYEELARTTLAESTRQAPAIAGGKLYLRDDREIVCVDVRRRE